MAAMIVFHWWEHKEHKMISFKEYILEAHKEGKDLSSSHLTHSSLVPLHDTLKSHGYKLKQSGNYPDKEGLSIHRAHYSKRTKTSGNSTIEIWHGEGVKKHGFDSTNIHHSGSRDDIHNKLKTYLETVK